jgi:hypothetical protein
MDRKKIFKKSNFPVLHKFQDCSLQLREKHRQRGVWQ